MFVTFEGIEGAGKTTQIRHLFAYLQTRGLDGLVTREPGGTAIGRDIRAILLDPGNMDMDFRAELLLYMADRVQHVNKVVKPALSKGRIVLCDRYDDATLAYQGFARGLDVGFIRALYQLVLGDFKPDLTFLLDLPPETGLSRAWKEIETGSRPGSETRFEKEKIAFHKKVRAGYLALARSEPERFKVIDASRDEEQVRHDTLAGFAGFFPDHTVE